MWTRMRERMQRRVRQQVTLSGVLFTALVTMVGLAAFASANNLLFLLFAALLSTLLVSGFVSRLGIAGLELDLELPEHIAARRRVVGRVMVRNSKWMPSFSIHLRGSRGSGMTSELYFPVLPAGSIISEGVELEFARRGLHKENDFEFYSRFPFGFAERREGVRLERELIIYPAIDSQPIFESLFESLAGDMESKQRGRGHDFYRIRPYAYNESARHVDWRATAHTGELQVREFARQEDRSVMLFLDLEVPPGAAERFETAIECCAFLVWRLSQAGARVRFTTQQWDRTVPDEADVWAILRYLALVVPASGAVPPPPDAERETCLAITSNPRRVADAGWMEDRILDVRSFEPARSDGERAAAGTGAHVHHDR